MNEEVELGMQEGVGLGGDRRRTGGRVGVGGREKKGGREVGRGWAGSVEGEERCAQESGYYYPAKQPLIIKGEKWSVNTVIWFTDNCYSQYRDLGWRCSSIRTWARDTAVQGHGPGIQQNRETG